MKKEERRQDSFSDGGEWNSTERALAHAHEMVDAGADIIDIGGESTRPGATRVDPDVERDRVVPVIAALHADGITTSVDTMRASTAESAVAAGVDIVNDVSGGLADPGMYRVVADANRTRPAGQPVDYCLMHWRADRFASAEGRADHGGDVVADVSGLLGELTEAALAAGVPDDPGPRYRFRQGRRRQLGTAARHARLHRELGGAGVPDAHRGVPQAVPHGPATGTGRRTRHPRVRR